MSEIYSALSNISMMPYGSARVEAARTLLERTTAEEDPESRFDVLSEAMESGMFGGAHDFVIALVPQLVNLRKEHPDVVDDYNYVWRLKWTVTSLPDFPVFPATRIRQMEDLFEAAIREVGGSTRTVSYVRWTNAFAEGRLTDAAHFAAACSRLRRDGYSDCMACEADSMVTYALAQSDYPGAMKAAEEILGRRLGCAEVPHRTYAKLVFPTLVAGNAALAAEFHQRGRKLLRGNAGMLRESGRHLVYLAAIGEQRGFLSMLRTILPWTETNRCPREHYDLYLGAWLGCRFIAEHHASRRFRLPLSQKLLINVGDATQRAEGFAELFETEIRRLASEFDARNGNQWYSDYLETVYAQVREIWSGRPMPEEHPSDVINEP